MLTACEGFAFHTVLSSDSLHSVLYIKITQIHLTFTWYTAMKHIHNATKLLKHTTFTHYSATPLAQSVTYSIIFCRGAAICNKN